MTDDLTIQQLRSIMDKSPAARAAEIRPVAPPAQQVNAAAPGAPSFADTLKESIAEINNLSIQADQAMEGLATGQNSNMQETILAVEKADISFKMMMEVRNKIISAYQEVMRSQV